MAISVEDARKLLAAEVEASSLNDVAGRVGIDRSTLRTFVRPGGVQKPIPRVLRPILAYAEMRLASASSAGSGEAGASPDGEGVATIALVEYGKLLGRLDTLEAWTGSMEQSMAAVRDQVIAVREQLARAATSAKTAKLPRPDIPLLPMTRLDPPEEEAHRRTG